MRRGEGKNEVELVGGMCGNNEDNPISEMNVGDDDGIKEYPFITSPSLLGAMERLRGAGRKELLLDFIKSAPYYDSCPKGSQLCKDAKLIPIPGPYHSCPILHEAGDDFLGLPVPQRRFPRPRTSMGFSRKPKKKPVCMKCSPFCFTHIDPELYYQQYLSSCTYIRIRNYQEADGAHHVNGPSKHSRGLVDLGENLQGVGEGESESRLTPRVRPSSALKSHGGEGKNGKTIKPKRIKTPVQSRYLQVLRRRLNSTPTTSSPPISKPPTAGSRDGEDQEPNNNNPNPFPMPDIFEEIYFGDMSEGLAALPSQLQAFKRYQYRAKNAEHTIPSRRQFISRAQDRLRHGSFRRSISNLPVKKTPPHVQKPASRGRTQFFSLKRTSKSQAGIPIPSPTIQPGPNRLHHHTSRSLPNKQETRRGRTKALKKAKSSGKVARSRKRPLRVSPPSPSLSHSISIPIKGKSKSRAGMRKTKTRKTRPPFQNVKRERRAEIPTLHHLHHLQSRGRASESAFLTHAGSDHKLKGKQVMTRDMNDGDGWVVDATRALSGKVNRIYHHK